MGSLYRIIKIDLVHRNPIYDQDSALCKTAFIFILLNCGLGLIFYVIYNIYPLFPYIFDAMLFSTACD